jgi:hypothetical protein
VTQPIFDANARSAISDARLRAVMDHVRAWLFAAPSGTAHTSEPPAGEE